MPSFNSFHTVSIIFLLSFFTAVNSIAGSCNQSFSVDENKTIDVTTLYWKNLACLHNYNCADIEIFRSYIANDIEELDTIIKQSGGCEVKLYRLLRSMIQIQRATLKELEDSASIQADKEKFIKSVANISLIKKFFDRYYCTDSAKCMQNTLNQIASQIVSSTRAVYDNMSKDIYNNIIYNLKSNLNYIEAQIDKNRLNKQIEQLEQLTELFNDLCELVRENCLKPKSPQRIQSINN